MRLGVRGGAQPRSTVPSSTTTRLGDCTGREATFTGEGKETKCVRETSQSDLERWLLSSEFEDEVSTPARLGPAPAAELKRGKKASKVYGGKVLERDIGQRW